MKLYDANQQELMQVRKIRREGSDLVVLGKIFGSMPISATLTPRDARAALKMMDFRTILFLLSMLFRR